MPKNADSWIDAVNGHRNKTGNEIIYFDTIYICYIKLMPSVCNNFTMREKRENACVYNIYRRFVIANLKRSADTRIITNWMCEWLTPTNMSVMF